MALLCADGEQPCKAHQGGMSPARESLGALLPTTPNAHWTPTATGCAFPQRYLHHKAWALVYTLQAKHMQGSKQHRKSAYSRLPFWFSAQHRLKNPHEGVLKRVRFLLVLQGQLQLGKPTSEHCLLSARQRNFVFGNPLRLQLLNKYVLLLYDLEVCSLAIALYPDKQ